MSIAPIIAPATQCIRSQSVCGPWVMPKHWPFNSDTDSCVTFKLTLSCGHSLYYQVHSDAIFKRLVWLCFNVAQNRYWRISPWRHRKKHNLDCKSWFKHFLTHKLSSINTISTHACSHKLIKYVPSERYRLLSLINRYSRYLIQSFGLAWLHSEVYGDRLTRSQDTFDQPNASSSNRFYWAGVLRAAYALWAACIYPPGASHWNWRITPSTSSWKVFNSEQKNIIRDTSLQLFLQYEI